MSPYCTFAFRSASFKAIGPRARLVVEGVLLLYLNHKIGSAAQVESEVNIVVPVLNQFGLALRKTDDPVQANQNYRNDEKEFEAKMTFHESEKMSPNRGLLLNPLLVRAHETRYGTAGDLDLEIVRLNSQYQSIIVHRYNRADDPS